jgi:hypothetical protein
VASTLWLTSHLCVGEPPPGITGVVAVEDAPAAAAVISSGGTALLPHGCLEDAKRAMAITGATETQIERAVVFGTTGSLPPNDQDGR